MSGFVKIAYKIENYIGVFPALYPGVPNRQGAAFAGAQFAAKLVRGPICLEPKKRHFVLLPEKN